MQQRLSFKGPWVLGSPVFRLGKCTHHPHVTGEKVNTEQCSKSQTTCMAFWLPQEDTRGCLHFKPCDQAFALTISARRDLTAEFSRNLSLSVGLFDL